MKTILLCLSALSLLAYGCGSSSSSASDAGTGSDSADGGTCATTASGSVTLTVTGLPAGVNAKVLLKGPSGEQIVTATTTVAAAKSGDYTVTASTVTQADPIVRKAFKATVSLAAAQVCDGQSVAITVDYSLIATSNKIWWGSQNSENGTLGYAPSTLATSGSPVATVAAKTDGHLPGAFDKSGNLWVVDGISRSLKRYTAESLATGGTKTPDIVLTADVFTGGIPGPGSMAFDASGNMWIGVIYAKKVVKLDAASLAASGNVATNVEISNVDAPEALAFDATGNLWIGAANRVLKFVSARLTTSTTAAADLSIEAQTPLPVVGTLSSAIGLAFDATKNLWVNYDGVLAKITPAEQAATVTSTITPGVQITADVLALPAGIAFDESGGLWLAYSAGKLAKFGQAQLAVSGKFAPDVVITSASVSSATMPALYPAPAALPLFAALP